MTKEDKELLLRDLCSRLPYGVKMINTEPYSDEHNPILTLSYISEDNAIGCRAGKGFMTTSLGSIKPYLFPLSSMTEEQKEEIENLGWYFDNFEIHNVSECLGTYREYVAHSDCFALIDWLNKNHFDYRNLINKNLAIDCTNLEIYK